MKFIITSSFKLKKEKEKEEKQLRSTSAHCFFLLNLCKINNFLLLLFVVCF